MPVHIGKYRISKQNFANFNNNSKNFEKIV